MYLPPCRIACFPHKLSPRLKRFDGLCCGAAGGRLKLRERRWVPGELVGAGEEAERHPLGRTEFAIIALSLYEPSHLHQELCRFACAHGRLRKNSSVSKSN